MADAQFVDTPDGEPIQDLANLARVELLSPRPEETVWFLHELLGLEIVAEDGNSTYLRCYHDYNHNTVKITGADESGLGRLTFQATSQAALERRVEAIQDWGLGTGWDDGDLGLGSAFEFESPDGHPMEVVWEVDPAEPHEDYESRLPNKPDRPPDKGIPAYRIDHVNLLTSEACTEVKNFMQQVLGFRLTEQVESAEGDAMGSWITINNKMHQISLMQDYTDAEEGRLHHLGFYYPSREYVLDLADRYAEANIDVEVGPAQHGIAEQFFMYAYEPGGNRIEVDARGYWVYGFNWEPVVWEEEQIDKAITWFGGDTPQDFYVYGTPDAPGQEEFGPRGPLYNR